MRWKKKYEPGIGEGPGESTGIFGCSTAYQLSASLKKIDKPAVVTTN